MFELGYILHQVTQVLWKEKIKTLIGKRSVSKTRRSAVKGLTCMKYMRCFAVGFLYQPARDIEGS